MEDDLKRTAAAAVRSLGKRGRTSRVPVAVRETVLSYVIAARRRRRPWLEIAAAVGLSATVLQRWQRSYPHRYDQHGASRGALVPVVVREREAPPVAGAKLTLVTPTGHRLEGLGVAEAADLLRRLA